MEISQDSLPDFIDETARDRVHVSGPDALTYLQSQVAQEIRDQAIGESRWTLVLQPTGKVDSLARITRTADDAFVLDIDAGFGEGLKARLDRFKIRVDAQSELVPAASSEASSEHDTARVAAGWPKMGVEIVPGTTIPGETGVVPISVSFTKGCYPGQELVERMDSRGATAPRSLRVIDVGEGAAPGDAVVDRDGAEVGTLTSVAGALGLGYVRRGSDVGRVPAH